MSKKNYDVIAGYKQYSSGEEPTGNFLNVLLTIQDLMNFAYKQGYEDGRQDAQKAGVTS